MDRVKQLGRLAENAFARWATAAEMTNNASTEDEEGWDYVVEFDLDEEESARDPITLDRDLTGLKAFVQVKGTDGTPGYRDLKLSNARSLIADIPSPSFLCVVEFDGGTQPQRAFLVHLGREFTANVLERLRELPMEEQERLHKRHIRVRYSSADRIEKTGEALREALLEPVRGDPRAYEQRKSKWLREVGYEEANAHFKFQIKPPEGYDGDAVDYIADFAAGLTSKLEVAGGKAWDVRFGIPQPSPEELRGGKIEAEQETKDVILECEAEDGSGRVRVGAELFQLSAMADAIPRDRRKVRISGPAVEMLLYTTENGVDRFGFSFQTDRPENLHRLQKTATLIQLLNRLAEEEKGVDVSLLLRDDFEGLDKSRIPIGRGKCEDFLDNGGDGTLAWSEYPKIATAIQKAYSIAEHFDLPQDTKATLRQAYRRYLGYHVLEKLTQGKQLHMKYTLTYVPDQIEDEKYAFVSPAVTQIGNWILLVAFGLIGSLQYEREDGEPIGTALVGETTALLDVETLHVKEDLPTASEYRDQVQTGWEDKLDDDTLLLTVEEPSWLDLEEPSSY